MSAPWFSVATRFLNDHLKEAQGPANNATIVEMFRVSGHPEVKDDETPWCAAFVGACLRLSGYKSSGSLGARSYQTFVTSRERDASSFSGATIPNRRRGMLRCTTARMAMASLCWAGTRVMP